MLMMIVLCFGDVFPAMADEAKPDAAAAPPPAAVQEEKPTFDFTTYALSKYVWRGYEETKNGIVIQPSMTVGYKGLQRQCMGEPGYQAVCGGAQYELLECVDGNGFYIFLQQDFRARQCRGRLHLLRPRCGQSGGSETARCRGALRNRRAHTLLAPTLTVYKEIDHYHQWYFLLGVSHSIELSKAVSLKLAASGSYLKSEDASPNDSLNVGYPKYTDSGQPTADKLSNFHDGQISASLPIAVAKYMTVTPIISYSCPLSNDAKKRNRSGLERTGQRFSLRRGGIHLRVLKIKASRISSSD